MKPLRQANICFLDEATLDLGDLDLSALHEQGSYRAYPISRQAEVVRRLQGVQIAITNKCLLRESELSRLPDLKLICLCATGVNNIDLTAAKRHGIAVTNVAGYSTINVAEHTLLFMLACAHRLSEHVRSVHHGDWTKSLHFTVLDYPFSNLAGKTLGIVGYGAIGKKVAKLARAFDMEILIAKLPGRKYGASPKRVHLDTLLRKSDFVSLHCALNETTQHLIKRDQLRLMKSSAYLLNLARGPVVKEYDVANALRQRQLAGYATDVLATEPPPGNHPLFQRDIQDKVLITPHVAWANRESRQNLIDEMAMNIQAFKAGKRRNRIV